MDKDRVEGGLKKTEGKLTGDTTRERQGQAQEKTGEVKKKVREASDKLTAKR